MALPRDRRLSRTADFAAVRESGRSWTGRNLVLAVRPRSDRDQAHFGFTTTRRIGNAVKRNLVRRRLRMIAREFSKIITATHDVVTIARHSAVKADYAALRQDWIRLARKAGLLPGDFVELVPRPVPAAAELRKAAQTGAPVPEDAPTPGTSP